MNHLKNIRISLIILLLGLLVVSIFAQSEITITAKQNLALQSKPDYDSDVLGVFQRGQEAAAFGRDEAGAWLQINDGWVIAKNVNADSDIMALPVTTNAVTVKAAASRSLRSGPDGSFDATGNLPSGETALALGRNGDGSWLQVSGGWIRADQVEISGAVMTLPITFSSITIRANINVALHRGPSRNAEVLAILARGEEAIATSRNEAGTSVQTPQGWVFVNRGLALEGEVMDLPPAPTVSVTAAQALTLYRWPALNSDSLSVVQQGEQDIAFGRNEAGDWLEIPGGWVSAEQGLETRGDVMRLPITGQTGIIITANLSNAIRSSPSGFVRLGTLRRGEEAVAIGRNEKGNWLRIEAGWVIVSLVKVDGDIMLLPIVSEESPTQSIAKASPRNSVTITVDDTFTTPVRSEPHGSSVITTNLTGGEKRFAYGRDENGDWLQIPQGWIYAKLNVKVDGDIMDLPITGQAGITITAKYNNVSVRSRPSVGYDVVGSLQRGEEVAAIGRDKDGKWLQVEDGWILVVSVNPAGNIMDLPVTSGESATKASRPDGIIIIATRDLSLRSGPGATGFDSLGVFRRDEEAVAIGRNQDSTWLQIWLQSQIGWIYATSRYFEADGNIMSLPVTSSTAVRTTTTSTGRATPTPSRSAASTSAFSEQSIRSQVNRYTDDIRILKINQSGSTTEIEYDLKPWPFVPNEQIAHEVLFKMICALRRGGQIPHKLEFTGQGHFKSDVGRKFKSPSVEIHISANNANRVICSGNTYSDINWRSLAARYQSYPIPRGASVDYG